MDNNCRIILCPARNSLLGVYSLLSLCDYCDLFSTNSCFHTMILGMSLQFTKCSISSATCNYVFLILHFFLWCFLLLCELLHHLYLLMRGVASVLCFPYVNALIVEMFDNPVNSSRMLPILAKIM